MKGIPNSRLADVFLIGPITILFSFFVKEWWLSLFILLAGVLTTVYNGLNWANLNLEFVPVIKWIPKGWKKNFIHPIRGKTQLVRLINLLVMYPLFAYAYWKVRKDLPGSTPFIQKVIIDIFGFFVFAGFLYNLKNFVKIQSN